jgi:hypothetical protein
MMPKRCGGHDRCNLCRLLRLSHNHKPWDGSKTKGGEMALFYRSRGWFARFQPGLALNRSGPELGPTQPSLDHLPRSRFLFFELPHFPL